MSSGSSLDIINATITNISSASVLGTGNVSIAYDVLERGDSEAVAVVGFTDIAAVPATFGGLFDMGETILIQLFIVDKNNPTQLMQSIASVSDKVMTSLKSDNTLQNTVEQISAIRASRTPGEAFINSTAVALVPINISVDVLRWPNG